MNKHTFLTGTSARSSDVRYSMPPWRIAAAFSSYGNVSQCLAKGQTGCEQYVHSAHLDQSVLQARKDAPLLAICVYKYKQKIRHQLTHLEECDRHQRKRIAAERHRDAQAT